MPGWAPAGDIAHRSSVAGVIWSSEEQGPRPAVEGAGLLPPESTLVSAALKSSSHDEAFQLLRGLLVWHQAERPDSFHHRESEYM